MRIEMPSAETYAKEMEYMPWRQAMYEVRAQVVEYHRSVNSDTGDIPFNAPLHVTDLMCGTGYLLGLLNVSTAWGGFILTGIDCNEEYLERARLLVPNATLIRADVEEWQPEKDSLSVVTLTGGLHHLPFHAQKGLIEKICLGLHKGGVLILAEPLFAPYQSDAQRRFVASIHGAAYLNAVAEAKAPPEVLQATMEITVRDIACDGEYKISVTLFEQLIAPYFEISKRVITWSLKRSLDPEQSGGDFVYVLKKPYRQP